MLNGILRNVRELNDKSNVSKSINTTEIYNKLNFTDIVSLAIAKSEISPGACFGFILLILTTIIGNTLVLSALFLDKRLHSPSFFLIANMAIADLLLGLFVLPFSSILELLNDRWIFGQSLCSAWLAIDVLCCTASIIALMAVSIDRYIGVTRPLTYSTIMTTRRTICLIILVWAVSILTSVVPLFGLTDRGTKPTNTQSIYDHVDTCKVNKNTFYTIFSSMISFYIPVIILLILYSRIYQEAKKQGQKLENEKRRLYEIDYQLVKHAQEEFNSSNGYGRKTRINSNQSDDNKHEITSMISHHDEELNLEKDSHDYKNHPHDDDLSHSASSIVDFRTRICRLFRKRSNNAPVQNATLTNPQPHYHHRLQTNDELAILKRKLQNLKREQKAFRTVGLILGALLICWLPFFVTLPVVSILRGYGLIKDENAENTWFKITFWLGYFNSALNPFVYAFSNRAIRRAFRKVIFRRCYCSCFNICPKKLKKTSTRRIDRRTRARSDSHATEHSHTTINRQPLHRTTDHTNTNQPIEPVLSNTDVITDKTNDDGLADDKKLNSIN